MKTLKRLLSVALAATLAVGMACMTGCGNTAKADYRIGVLQAAKHTALDAARDGFTETLNRWAEENGKTIEFDLQNAQGDQNNEKTIAANLVAKNCDLLLGIATSSARALATATTKIPTLFTAVTDPVVGNISGVNVTGTSDMAPIDQRSRSLKKSFPIAKKWDSYTAAAKKILRNKSNSQRRNVKKSAWKPGISQLLPPATFRRSSKRSARI